MAKAKVIGFTKRVDGFQTRAGKLNQTMFVNACKAVSEKTGVPYETYLNKRQAGKFFRGQGIVFNSMGN